MDGYRDCHIQWGKPDKYHILLLINGVLKKRYNLSYIQNRNRHTGIKNKLMVTKGKGVGYKRRLG